MAIYEPWRDKIAEPMARDHFVQVYRDERVLIEAVSLFAGAALGCNEAVVLVATRAHGDAVEESLARDGFDIPTLKPSSASIVSTVAARPIACSRRSPARSTPTASRSKAPAPRGGHQGDVVRGGHRLY
jgi:hypothetical protein